MNWVTAKDLLKSNADAKISSALCSVTEGNQYIQDVDVVAPNGNTVRRLRKITPAEGENPEVVERFIRKECDYNDWADIS